MRSLGQTSGSHDCSSDTAIFLFSIFWGGSWNRWVPLVIQRGQRSDLLSWVMRAPIVMGRGHTCTFICQLPHFQAVTLNSGNLNRISLSFPLEGPCLSRRWTHVNKMQLCLLVIFTGLCLIVWNLRVPFIKVVIWGIPLCLSFSLFLSVVVSTGSDRAQNIPLRACSLHTHTNMSQSWYARHAYAIQRRISIHSVGRASQSRIHPEGVQALNPHPMLTSCSHHHPSTHHTFPQIKSWRTTHWKDILKPLLTI